MPPDTKNSQRGLQLKFLTGGLNIVYWKMSIRKAIAIFDVLNEFGPRIINLKNGKFTQKNMLHRGYSKNVCATK